MKRLIVALALLAGVAHAQTPTPATFNPVPGENASFFSTLRTFLLGEDADRDAAFGNNGRRFADLAYNQCVHGTAVGMTGTFAGTCLGFVDGVLIVDPAASINYSTQGATAADFCWVILTKLTTTANAGWTRVAGTHYMTDCTTASGTRPARPAESMFVMGVTIAGSAITDVDNLTNHVPWHETYTATSERTALPMGLFWQQDQSGLLSYSNGTTLVVVPTGDTAGCATCGDTATAFFSAGTIEAARGGTGDNTSATTGVPIITAGNWTYPTFLDEALGGLGSDFSGCDGVPVFTAGVTSCQPYQDTTTTLEASRWSADALVCVKTENGALTTNVPGPYVICGDNAAGLVGGLMRMPINATASVPIAATLTGVQGAATAGTIAIDFTCLCVTDNQTLDAANFPAAINLDLTFSTTAGDFQEASNTITCGGACAPSDTLIWRGSVDAANTTTPSTLRLIALTIQSANDGQNN